MVAPSTADLASRPLPLLDARAYQRPCCSVCLRRAVDMGSCERTGVGALGQVDCHVWAIPFWAFPVRDVLERLTELLQGPVSAPYSVQCWLVRLLSNCPTPTCSDAWLVAELLLANALCCPTG